MIHTSLAELQKLARAARLTLPGDAQERIVAKLEAVLSYAELLSTVERPLRHCEEVQQLPLRPDYALTPVPAQLLAHAPHIEENYFVVPAVISGK